MYSAFFWTFRGWVVSVRIAVSHSTVAACVSPVTGAGLALAGAALRLRAATGVIAGGARYAAVSACTVASTALRALMRPGARVCLGKSEPPHR